MPPKNIVNLVSDVDTDFPDNTTGLITPVKLRGIIKTFIESVYNRLTDRVTINVDSVAALRALPALDGVRNINLLGYFTPGDGGGGNLYVDIADTTSSDDAGAVFVVLTAIRVKRVFDAANLPNVRQFGARGNNTVDDTLAIQKAIDWCIRTQFETLLIPPGQYRITDTLKVGKGDDLFSCLHIRGTSKSQSVGNCRILLYANDRPAINFQGSRYSSISYLSIRGFANKPETLLAGDAFLGLHNINDWLTPEYSNTQFSPHCGISVDAYSGPAPTNNPYPNDTYNRYHSSGVLIECVEINGFICGSVIKPSDFDANAEDIRIHKSTITGCVYGVSFGGSQTRVCSITDTNISICFVAITALRHGKRIGDFPKLSNLDLTVNFRLFEVEGTIGSNSITACYAENFTELGILGRTGSAANCPVIFQGCGFTRQTINSGIFAVAYQPITFIGCTIYTNDANGIFNFANLSYSNLTFDNCIFGYNGAERRCVSGSIESPQSLRFINGTSQGANNLLENISSHFQINGLPQRLPLSAQTESIYDYQFEASYVVSKDVSYIKFFGTPVISGTTLTLTLTTLTDISLFRVGDFISWRFAINNPGATTQLCYLPAFKITAINTGTGVLTCSALTSNFYYHNEIDFFYLLRYPYFTNKINSTCLTAINSNTLTQVSEISNWNIGDWVRGENIPNNTRITTISGNTITLSKNATTTKKTEIYNTRLTRLNQDFGNLDPDSYAHYQQIILNNGSISANSLNFVDLLIKGLKADGIWDLIIDAGVFAGNNLATSLIKIKSPFGVPRILSNNGFIEADFVENAGLDPGSTNTTKFLDTGVSEAFINPYDSHLSFYSRTANGRGIDREIGTAQDDSLQLIIGFGGTAGYYRSFANNTGIEGTAAIVGTQGFFLGTKTSSTNAAYYKNGVAIATTTTADTNANAFGSDSTISVFRANKAQNSSSKVCAYYSIGRGFTAAQALAYYNRIQAFQNQMTRAV